VTEAFPGAKLSLVIHLGTHAGAGQRVSPLPWVYPHLTVGLVPAEEWLGATTWLKSTVSGHRRACPGGAMSTLGASSSHRSAGTRRTGMKRVLEGPC